MEEVKKRESNKRTRAYIDPSVHQDENQPRGWSRRARDLHDLHDLHEDRVRFAESLVRKERLRITRRYGESGQGTFYFSSYFTAMVPNLHGDVFTFSFKGNIFAVFLNLSLFPVAKRRTRRLLESTTVGRQLRDAGFGGAGQTHVEKSSLEASETERQRDRATRERQRESISCPIKRYPGLAYCPP